MQCRMQLKISPVVNNFPRVMSISVLATHVVTPATLSTSVYELPKTY